MRTVGMGSTKVVETDETEVKKENKSLKAENKKLLKRVEELEKLLSDTKATEVEAIKE